MSSTRFSRNYDQRVGFGFVEYVEHVEYVEYADDVGQNMDIGNNVDNEEFEIGLGFGDDGNDGDDLEQQNNEWSGHKMALSYTEQNVPRSNSPTPPF